MVVEWGVSMMPARVTPDAAQQDAERFRHAVVELGYQEQRGLEVCAHAFHDSAETIVGWRGCVNLGWFIFAVAHDGQQVRALPAGRPDGVACWVGATSR
jgi:hypothetical protein